VDARLAVIMEQPGGEEGKFGTPAVGPSGGELDKGLGGSGVRAITYVTNVRKCCPEGEETEAERAASIAHCTAAYLTKEVGRMTNVKAVLLVGADALQWGTGLHAYSWTKPDGRRVQEPGIMQYSGSVFTAQEANGVREILTNEGGWRLPQNAHTVVVTLHPAFAMRGQHRLKVEILANIARAVATANSPAPVPREQRQRIIFDPDPIGFAYGAYNTAILDIETPDDDSEKIEVCGVSGQPNEAHVFDWKPDYASKVGGILTSKQILKVGHNFSFDTAAFKANGLEIVFPVADTIIAAARIWPPTAQKKLNEVAAKDKIPIKWLSLDRVALRLLSDVVYWKRPESRATQAFYKVAFPSVSYWKYRKLYCGLDCIYTHRVWRAERELLQNLKLMDRFQKIDMPAFLPMVNMEARGLLVDEARRATLQEDAAAAQVDAEQQIAEIAQRFHEKRVAAVENGLKVLDFRKAVLLYGMAYCAKHPDYYGQTKRTKQPCCAAIMAENAESVASMKEAIKQTREGEKKLKQIGPTFDPSKPDHWRWLLFEPEGLNSERPRDKWIKPVARTKKQKLPQIDDKAMERLQRKYPDVTLFKLKVEATYAAWRLNNTLAVPVNLKTGRAHTRLSIHRTSTARYASGTDREDSAKIRYAAAGNQQNIPDADRSIYCAPPGYKLLAPDYSQIEARVTAWHAKEWRLLDAWARGEDIHTNNAVLLAAAIGVKLDPADARRLPFPYDPQGKSYRDNGKRLTHAWDYGMGPNKTAREYGLPLEIAQKLHASYFERYPALAERTRVVEWTALKYRFLRNSFGLMLGPYDKEKRDGVWVLADREEALAAQPQSDVGDMMKIVSVPLDRLDEGPHKLDCQMVVTMHDNFWFYVKEGQALLAAHVIKAIMERFWGQLGILEKYGMFSCPVEISIGDNGGKLHVHDAACQARGCDAPENPNGLVKMKMGEE